MVVELGPVGDADGKDGVDEPDGDQFEVIAERVVEVERRLAQRAWPGRSRDDDAVLGETIHPPEQVPGTDGERDVRVHRRDRDALGILEDVKARAAGQGQLQMSGVVLLDVLAGPAQPFQARRVEPEGDPRAEESDVTPRRPLGPGTGW